MSRDSPPEPRTPGQDYLRGAMSGNIVGIHVGAVTAHSGTSVLVEQRGVFPDVLVPGTDQEPRPRRQREEVCHLWAPGNQV